MNRIRITVGGEVVHEADVDRDLVVGRSESASLRVADSEISSKHLRIAPDGDRVTVTDLGSTNGSVLDDGTRLAPNEPIVLERGRKVMVGPAIVELVTPATANSSDFFEQEKTIAVGGGGQVQAALIAVAKFKAAAPRIVVGAEHDRRTVPLDEMDSVIGRDREGVRVEVRHASVSGQHARLTYKDGAFELRDLGSSNGTFVDGNRIEGAARIQAETVVSFGTVDCLFTCNQPQSDDAAQVAEALVQHAVAMSKATQAQARQVLDEHRQTGRTLGEIFVEKGILTPREWVDLWRQREAIVRLGATSGGGSRSWMVLVVVLVAIAAAAYFALR